MTEVVKLIDKHLGCLGVRSYLVLNAKILKPSTLALKKKNAVGNFHDDCGGQKSV